MTIDGCEKYETNTNSNIVYITVSELCNTRGITASFSLNGNKQSVKLNEGVESLLKMGDVNYRVSLFKEKTWRNIEVDNGWEPRDGAGVVILNNRIFLLGGWVYETTQKTVSEAWVTDDLITWQRLPDPPWKGRHGAGWVVHKNRIYVVGGDLIDDVWYTEDGTNWTLANGKAPFGERYTPIVHSDGEYMYLYGGMRWDPAWWCDNGRGCWPVAYNDVWRSRDGVEWEKILNEAPWAGRALVHGSLYYQGEIFLIAGGMKINDTWLEYNDIWSSKDGISWQKRSDSLGFLPRTHVSVLATSKGCYVSDGSVTHQANVSNDLYFSTDCINYNQIGTPSEMQRRHASSLFEFNGSVVILGGPPVGGAGRTIWQYFPKLGS